MKEEWNSKKGCQKLYRKNRKQSKNEVTNLEYEISIFE